MAHLMAHDLAAPALEPIAQIIRRASTPFKLGYWPTLTLIPVLHAARISVAFRNNARLSRGGAQVGLLQDMAGYLLMCWGGQVMVNMLLNQPPPMLVSHTPWMIYPTVHLICGLLCDLLPNQNTLDMLLFGVDAITRQAPIVNAVQLAKNSSNLTLAHSLTAQIVLAALASAGGSGIASALNVWDQDWRLSAPSSLRRARGSPSLLPSVDLWAGALAGAIYSAATLSHPFWATVFLEWGWRTNLEGPVFTDSEARALVVVVLSTVYAWRVAAVALSGPGRPTPKQIDAAPSAAVRATNRKDR